MRANVDMLTQEPQLKIKELKRVVKDLHHLAKEKLKEDLRKTGMRPLTIKDYLLMSLVIF
ncbi:MAG: hypothetical protein QN229_00040 [Desulfurococcaceae archaeon TW002]